MEEQRKKMPVILSESEIDQAKKLFKKTNFDIVKEMEKELEDIEIAIKVMNKQPVQNQELDRLKEKQKQLQEDLQLLHESIPQTY